MIQAITAIQLDARAVLQYKEDGFLIVRGVFKADFSGYTPHRSSPNRSSSKRHLLYLSYNAFSDGGEQREGHYAEFAEWLKDRYAEYGKTMTYFR